MTTSFDGRIDAAFRGRPLADVLDAPVSALLGVSAADAERLRASFGIQTVAELGTSRYFQLASAMVAVARLRHDPGPDLDWAAFFATAPLQHCIDHPAGRFRLDFGPVYYRGRLDGSARVLIVGQDPSTNEILAHRIFVGQSGQRVQRLLEKVGITRSYVMLNAFLFSVFGQFDTQLESISEEPAIESFRNAYLDRIMDLNRIEAIISFGKGARHAVTRWPGVASFPTFHAMHPAAPESNVIADWNSLLPGIRDTVQPDEDGTVDPAPFGATFEPRDHTPIPDFDLPFGVPEWHGRNGGHSNRDGDKIIEWRAP